MTPALRELLKRHPAPWNYSERFGAIVDATGNYFLVEAPDVKQVFVELVNAASEVNDG